METHLDKLKRAYDLTGRTFVITGGTGVLGAEIVCGLVHCGAQVAVLHRNAERGQALLERLKPYEKNAELFQGDVLDAEGLRQLVPQILQRFGAIDGLINAAGGNQRGATTGPELTFFDLSADALRQVFDLNFLGTLHCCQAFGKIMAEQKSGVILNVSSMSAFRPLTRVAAYSAAKAGINNFTQWLAVHMAQEYSPLIRVNAIAPGFFLTEQNRFLLLDAQSGKTTPRGQAILAHTPMARFGEAQDLVGATLWLLSPASGFVTGAVVPIDGGFSAFGGV
jgi:NAD(P)-dependent dehydrogenase (short-subunit alcohol dehydrogenase family)